MGEKWTSQKYPENTRVSLPVFSVGSLGGGVRQALHSGPIAGRVADAGGDTPGDSWSPFFNLNHMLLFMLLELSQFFSPLLPSTQTAPHSLRQPLLSMSVGRAYMFFGLSFLCCTSHSRDYSVTTNLYFSIPSPFLPIPPTPLPHGNCQNVLCI